MSRINAIHERDASKKWCPFTINPLIEQSTTGASSSTAVSVNRGHDLDNKCLGSMCMAWRWADERRHLGYCGLATSSVAAAGHPAGTEMAGVSADTLSGLEVDGEEATAQDDDLAIAQELRTCGLCSKMEKKSDVPEGYDGYCPIFDVFTKSSFQCDPTDDHWTPAEGVCGSCRHMTLGSTRDGYDGFCDKIGGYVRFTDDCPTGLWLKGTPSRGE
jgi:hypothetical protein